MRGVGFALVAISLLLGSGGVVLRSSADLPELGMTLVGGESFQSSSVCSPPRGRPQARVGSNELVIDLSRISRPRDFRALNTQGYNYSDRQLYRPGVSDGASAPPASPAD